MKLSAMMTVYNEVEFIDYAIQNCISHVDFLHICEGSYLETQNLGKSARSNDGTLEIIEKYRNHPKVNIVYANEQTDKDQRNKCLENIKSLNPNGWMYIHDGDEVYKSSTFPIIRNACNLLEQTQAKAAYFKSLTFVNDFNHYCEQSFPRLFKITEKCKFVNDNFMSWEDVPAWQNPYITHLHNIQYFHYSFLKGSERFKTKRDWWMNRGLGPNFDYGWTIDENGKITDKNHKIYEFNGNHPDIIKSHPKYEALNG